MSIRIRKLDDGYLVSDDSGPRLWEGAAVSLADAETMARHRSNPWTAAAPPRCLENSGYAEAVHPLAERQFEQATGGNPNCVGSLCSAD